MVVAAAIVRDGRVLAARRSAPAELAGGWEFPGGKVEAGEAARSALVRECREELGVEISVGGLLAETAPDTPVTVRLYAAQLLAGNPRPLQTHDALCWLRPSELVTVGWLDLDLELLDSVKALLDGESGDPGHDKTVDTAGERRPHGHHHL